MYTMILSPVLGWMWARRILLHWHRKKIVKSNWLHPLEMILLIFFLVIAILARKSVSALLFFSILLDVAVLFLPAAVEALRRKAFHNLILVGLDSLLMSLRSGHSLNEALSEASNQSSVQKFGFYFTEICRLVWAKQTSGPVCSDILVHRVFQELQNITQSSYKVTERLWAFRQGIALEAKFQRKSRAATIQAKAQSFLMLLLFLSALIYVLSEYGFSQNRGTIAVASVLFGAGFFWVQLIGRKNKWKV